MQRQTILENTRYANSRGDSKLLEIQIKTNKHYFIHGSSNSKETKVQLPSEARLSVGVNFFCHLHKRKQSSFIKEPKLIQSVVSVPSNILNGCHFIWVKFLTIFFITQPLREVIRKKKNSHYKFYSVLHKHAMYMKKVVATGNKELRLESLLKLSESMPIHTCKVLDM